MRVGKVINGFIDDLILIFSASYTGLANKRLKAQQAVIDELSTPVISIVDGVAVLPIIGDIDTHRARVLREHTLREANRQEVDCLILDLSGVFIVDTMVAQELFKIIDGLKLTGVEVNLTGIRPELAHSVVTLGIRFDDVKMYNNLGQALKAFGVVRK
ncbi:STAS domain-containing protein [Mesobacillus sp. AQ2]|nr:STAS domain-containing protein [Mesobacillus sp. AQ2]WHX38592.1 STAS domain-containing protein [Mesobacillus sp. AQ2]